MIVVTGDIHGQSWRLEDKRLDVLTEDDFVVILGDFGIPWDYDITQTIKLQLISEMRFKTLFIDGNHENFAILNSLPVENWHGGKVHHVVKDKVIHLMRGQVYEIDGHKMFTFGGGKSHDIQGGVLSRQDKDFYKKAQTNYIKGLPYRIIGESWWKEEMPSDKEYKEGLKNLERNNWQVDYIFTHDVCESVLPDIQRLTSIPDMESDELNKYLEGINSKTTYKTWFSGHNHVDSVIDDKHIAMFKDIRELR